MSSIDFWYCTTDEGALPVNLEDLCAEAGVTLHRHVTGRTSRLTAEILRDLLGDLDDVAVWFCGPTAFARNLSAGLAASGFDVERSFLREEFDFR